MYKILIADDHEIVRKGLKQILDDTTDMAVTGEAITGQDAIQKVIREEFDVVVLDLSMPGRGGLDALQSIKQLKPNLPVLILTYHTETQYALRVFKAGADGFLNKQIASDELVNALRIILKGRRYISVQVAEQLVVAYQDGDKMPHDKLSDREFTVMQMIALGFAVKEIAEKMNLSPKTVSTYRSRVLEKMCMQSNVDIVDYVFHNKLLE